MGYYVHVQPRSKKAAQEMLAFLAEHFRSIRDLCPWITEDWAGRNMDVPPTWGKDVCAYAKNKTDIGYYRSAGWSQEENHYCSNLLRWIAIKIGKPLKVRADFYMEDEHCPQDVPWVEVPTTYYEQSEVPIFRQSEHPNALDGWASGSHAKTDDLGWLPHWRPMPEGVEDYDEDSPIGQLRARSKQSDPIFRAELERLEALWQQR